MLTTKDFVALADVLRGLTVPEPVLAALVSFCRGQNSRFSESIWRKYLAGKCGPHGGLLKKGNRAGADGHGLPV